jgi:N-acetylglucosaminyldiphosphoundecaprenol N-acetyl-beta-D-mannosaminyltransferase
MPLTASLTSLISGKPKCLGVDVPSGGIGELALRRSRRKIEVKLNRLSLLDINTTVGSPKDFVTTFGNLSNHRNSAYVCFLNVHMLMEARNDPAFREIVNNADVCCPDGLPIARSLALLHGRIQRRIAGPDLLPELMRVAHDQGKTIFVLGCTNDVLAAFEENARSMFGEGLVVGTYSPPFRAITAEEDDAIVERINQSRADMIFVSLGCPKQEKWMASHKGRIRGCMFGMGYAIPVFAGMAKRAPRWMRESGMEWAFRLALNPRRLFQRYMRTNFGFIYQVFVEKVRKDILS